MRYIILILFTITFVNFSTVEGKSSAWILWEKYDTITFIDYSRDEGYRIIESYNSHDSCKEDRYSVWKKRYNIWEGVVKNKKDGSWISIKKCCHVGVYLNDLYRMDSDYLCLPDTIDPREKGR